MSVNITAIKTSSNGVWEGDNPLHFAFPLLIVQTTLVLVVSRLFAFLLKPLRQPKVIAEILGGIILGPSAFGRNQDYMQMIFPKWSTPILESVASIGLLFFLFLVGLELDLSSIKRSGRMAFTIAAAGISLPFILGIGIAFVFRNAVPGADKVGYAQYLVFMGVSLSITAFPVLARILAELKLLTTRVGETAMAAAAFNDIAAWILLALAIALAGDGPDGPHKSPLISIWVLLTGAAFVTIMMVFIKPIMKLVGQKCTSEHDSVNETYICLTLAGVMVSGFITDLIGIHAIFGAFVFGLTIPKGGYFGERLIERIEDFVSGLLLPLYFASSGLKTDVAKIRGVEAWGLLGLVITTACAGKIFGTFFVAIMCKIPARESLTLGFLMNTKGLVELIVLNIGKEKKVLNDEVFAILVLMALFTTFITTPVVIAIYKPARASLHSFKKLRSVSDTNTITTNDNLRVLACVHSHTNIPSIINLIESTRSANKSTLKLYVMQLVEFTERSSSILMVQRLQKNGLPFINRLRRSELHDRVEVALQAYGQLSRVSIRATTAISGLSTMHEDICHVANDKRVNLLILPFHKQWRKVNGNFELENVGHGWMTVNQKVMMEARSTVAVIVDRGFGCGNEKNDGVAEPQRVGVLFLGGADDREALDFGGRMAEHPSVKVTVIGFVPKQSDGQLMLQPPPGNGGDMAYGHTSSSFEPGKEKELDDVAVAEFRRRWTGVAEYREKVTSNIVDDVLSIGRSGEFDLIIVGKGHSPSSFLSEHQELGPFGDLLASSDQGIVSSALVIQHGNMAEEIPVSMMSHGEEDSKVADYPV